MFISMWITIKKKSLAYDCKKKYVCDNIKQYLKTFDMSSINTKKMARKPLGKNGGYTYTQTLTESSVSSIESYLESSHFSSVQELTRIALDFYMKKNPVK